MPVWLGSDEVSLPGCRLLTSVLTGWKESELALWPLLTRALILLRKALLL